MSLKTLVFISAFLYTLFIGGGLLGYRLLIVYPALKQATSELHKQDIEAVYGAYQEGFTNLQQFNNDWAKWDDAHEYALNGSTPFIENNLVGSFLDSGIDAVIVMTRNGNIRYAGLKDGEKFSKISMNNPIFKEFNLQDLLDKDLQIGFIKLNGQQAYFSSSLIQDSSEQSEPSGALIFIKKLSKEFHRKIELITNANVSIYPTNAIHELNPESEPFLNTSEIETNKVKNKYHIWFSNKGLEPIAIIEIAFSKSSIPEKIDTITMLSIAILLALPIVITIVIWFLFLTPIVSIHRQLTNMINKESLYELKGRNTIKELAYFQDAFNNLIKKVQNYQEKLKLDSIIDGLTGIYNRRFFDETFDKSWRASTRNKTPLAIIMMDIDYFKKYNDHYGHQQGDEALIAVAQSLQNHTRRAFDVLARYGGEEFVMLCQPNSHDDLKEILNGILTGVSNLQIPHIESEVSDNLTISCGACLISNPDLWMKNSQDLALKMADQALYKAKNSGRNCYYVSAFNPLNKNKEITE